MTSFFKSIGTAVFLSVMSLSTFAAQEMADATTEELTTVEESVELSQDMEAGSEMLGTEEVILDAEPAYEPVAEANEPSDIVEVCYTENGEEVPCEGETN